MPRQPKNVRDKGHFIIPGHRPCKEHIPRSAITEWLELDSPGNIISTIEEVDGKLHARATALKASPAPNRMWIANEMARLKSRNKNPDIEFFVYYSKNEQFACICKRHKKQKE